MSSKNTPFENDLYLSQIRKPKNRLQVLGTPLCLSRSKPNLARDVRLVGVRAPRSEWIGVTVLVCATCEMGVGSGWELSFRHVIALIKTINT